jgi:hypothetical protein|nr:MAG TPA: major tail protein [Caudoviricetes sp.]
MAITYKDVFSEYEIKESSIKIEGEETFEKIGCVGSIEETLETITVTKKCEGLVVKSVTRGSGNGEVKLSLHMRYDLYTKMFGMEDETLADGVLGYGQNSRHKNFAFVAKVKDEDANVKYIAYPKLIIQSGPTNKIENGAEDVAEIEITATVQPDENGFAKYEALDTLLDTTIKGQWMTAFTPDLVKKTQA